MRVDNLFTDLPSAEAGEVFGDLFRIPGARLERIVSHGQATPAGEWLVQDRHEWVILLEGSAGLRFEGDATAHILKSGDHVHIPAGCPHRVEWTHPHRNTVWLALHHDAEPCCSAGVQAKDNG